MTILCVVLGGTEGWAGYKDKAEEVLGLSLRARGCTTVSLYRKLRQDTQIGCFGVQSWQTHDVADAEVRNCFIDPLDWSCGFE